MPWLRRVRSPYRTREQLVIILSMWVVIERLYVRVTPRTEMRWTLSKPCTVGGGRSVCRQDLGLVNTISLDLDRLNFFHCFIALDETCNIERGHPNFGFTLIYAFFHEDMRQKTIFTLPPSVTLTLTVSGQVDPDSPRFCKTVTCSMDVLPTLTAVVMHYCRTHYQSRPPDRPYVMVADVGLSVRCLSRVVGLSRKLSKIHP